MPLTLSWSALRSHEECRQKALLQRTGKSNPAADIRGYFHGTVVDRVMRRWLESENPLPGEMADMVEDIRDQEEIEAIRTGDGVVRWRSVNDKAIMTNFCRELVVKLEPILQELVLPYDYQPEVRYRTPIMIPYLDSRPTMVYMAGGIDIVVRRSEDPPEWYAYDLKGTANDKYVNSVLGQGIFYDISMEALYGHSPVRFGFIQPMCKEKIVYANITDDDRRQMMVRIERMAHYMWRKDWTPKETTSGCTQCPVKHHCVKFTPVRGSRSGKAMPLGDDARKRTEAAMESGRGPDGSAWSPGDPWPLEELSTLTQELPGLSDPTTEVS